MEESILIFSRVSLLEFSLEGSLKIVGIRVYIYSRVRRNVKSQFFPSRVFWRLDLATGLSREFKLRANGLASLKLLSCSATASVTLQLLACLAHVQLLATYKL